jgi:hypothetical protein
MDINEQKKMTKEWKDRALGGAIALLIAIIPVLVGFKMTTRYDEKQTVIEKIQDLDSRKMDAADFRSEKTEIIQYIDKNDQKLRDELNSKLDIVIDNQVETINLLQNINRNTK